MTDTQITQLELPFPPASESVQYRPFLTIDGKDLMEAGEPRPSEEEAASQLFFNLNLMSIMLSHEGAKLEVTRRDPVSFTAYLYTEDEGAQVVRGGIEWVTA